MLNGYGTLHLDTSKQDTDVEDLEEQVIDDQTKQQQTRVQQLKMQVLWRKYERWFSPDAVVFLFTVTTFLQIVVLESNRCLPALCSHRFPALWRRLRFRAVDSNPCFPALRSSHHLPACT